MLTEKQIWISTKLFMFTKTPPLDNVKVRQALAHAIDRQAIVDAILGGVGAMDDNWAAPGVQGYHPSATTYPYDPERAKQLLAESGVSGPIDIVLARQPEQGPLFGQLTESIVGMAEKVGIRVTVKSVQSTEFNQALFGDADVRPWHGFVGGFSFSSGTVAQLFAQEWLETALSFTDPTYVDLGAKVLSTPDGDARQQLFADVEDRIAELAPLTTLYANRQIDAHRTTVHGFVTSNVGKLTNYGQVYLEA